MTMTITTHPVFERTEDNNFTRYSEIRSESMGVIGTVAYAYIGLFLASSAVTGDEKYFDTYEEAVDWIVSEAESKVTQD